MSRDERLAASSTPLPEMRYRLLGRTGLRVSELCLGAMMFGGGGSSGASREEAGAIVKRFADAGGNFIDTANRYARGESERIVGELIRPDRDRWVLATKYTLSTDPDDPNAGGSHRKSLRRAIDASLERLGTDYIDLYQVHGWDALTPLEETLGALDDLVRSGKVRYIGCSNYSAWHLMKSLSVSELRDLERFCSQQVNYSLVARELENELVPLSLDQGVGILVWSPLAAGFLSGKFRRGQDPPEGTRLSALGAPGTIDEERGYDIVDALVEVAEAHGVSPAQAAINWLLRQRGVTSVIIGARNLEQLEDNLGAASWDMTEDELNRLDEASEPPQIYPYWHQRKFAADRIPEFAEAG